MIAMVYPIMGGHINTEEQICGNRSPAVAASLCSACSRF